MSPTTATIAGRELSFTCHGGLLAGSGPQNALAGIEECLRAGASRIEIDVHSLADGEYLVCHANRLEKVTTSSGPVGQITRAEVLQLRGKHGHARPPLLSEVVELAGPYTSELQLDLNDRGPLTEERVRGLAEIVEPIGKRAIVSSGRDWNLRAIAREAPEVPLGFDPDQYFDARRWLSAGLPARRGAYGYRDDHPLAAERTQSVETYVRERFDILLAQVPTARELFINYRLLLQLESDGVLLPEFLHQRGVAVSAWTLDFDGERSLQTLRKLAGTGVERVTTNTARQFIEALSKAEET
jgi:glycerophosphoryl diester phosphodiesterase